MVYIKTKLKKKVKPKVDLETALAVYNTSRVAAMFRVKDFLAKFFPGVEIPPSVYATREKGKMIIHGLPKNKSH